MNGTRSLIGVILGSRRLFQKAPSVQDGRLTGSCWDTFCGPVTYIHSTSIFQHSLKYGFQDCFTEWSFQTYKPLIWHISLKPFFILPFQRISKKCFDFQSLNENGEEEMLKFINPIVLLYFVCQEAEPHWVSVIWLRSHVEQNRDLNTNLGAITRDHSEHR